MQVVPPNLALAKKLNRWAWILSGIVFLLVVGMRQPKKIDLGIDFSFLPAVYSTLNGIVAILLIIALVAIKRGNAKAHRKFTTSAMIGSVLFLLGYVVYHITTPETLYCGVGAIRYVYFFLLITHIVLAAVILPFILFTFIRAYTNQFDKHRKMAKWVFPLWLYVAITGPVLYMFLSPCYK